MKSYQAVVETPLGRVGVLTEDGYLTGIDFLSDRKALLSPRDATAAEVVRQLEGYFRNPSASFSVPVRPGGTAFQARVWQALRTIAPGTTRTYGAVAAALSSGARAVGGACRANPIPIVIPCHRVIARDGLGGFSGRTEGLELEAKRWMLSHEGNPV